MNNVNFIWDAKLMSLVSGRLPIKNGQLLKGKSTEGKEMEIVYCDGDLVCYWGWS